MRQEKVILSNVDIAQLQNAIKWHLKDLNMEIMREDKFDKYWSVRATRGGGLSVYVGSIRDVEVMIAGPDNENKYELMLRTEAWGMDIAIPAFLASLISAPFGAAVAGAEAYRAYKFEKDFWTWLKEQVKRIARGEMKISEPVEVETHK